MTLKDTSTFTSSPESADGLSLFGSPDGPMIDPSGPAHAPVSRSAVPARGRAKPTSATSGPRCSGSSASVALQSSLESRLRPRLDTVGSMEYSQTWREKATPAGRSYWAHTASARRTSGSGATGWPSPTVEDELCGALTGWATPTSRDHKDTGCLDNVPVNCLLGRQVALSPAETGSTAASRLNPRFSLWLIGFPVAWASCGEQAMPSCRKSRRSS